ncbi:MAG: Rrf2 family transcriptional regulator [Armatimonadetes bacterium]|nr:Rrf2 family transcriptional regulator [Armatimonadota bacterium]MDW8152699.1 Rrf2 family transcriptional regulator [Armatimonadota bacterium]
MRLTRETEYALRALSYLAGLSGGEAAPASRVAQACGLPREFLSKTLRRLVRLGLLRSSRGRSRGYALTRSPREISVREVLEAVEGPDYFRRCVFWDSRCSEDRPCVLHPVWAGVRPQLVEALGRITLDALLEPWWARDPPELRSPFWLPGSETNERKGGEGR